MNEDVVALLDLARGARDESGRLALIAIAQVVLGDVKRRGEAEIVISVLDQLAQPSEFPMVATPATYDSGRRA